MVEENDFEGPYGDLCLLRRVIDGGGRSRAYINGAAATLAQLKMVADRLADIHGQHAHHSLLRADAQRQLLIYSCRFHRPGAPGCGRISAWQRLREARENAERDANRSWRAGTAGMADQGT